uniref:Uncharacterized protein n=1 Tax=Anguilla anguilla TaxID=7936 RepID=A0A0E9XDS1_ANGAN
MLAFHFSEKNGCPGRSDLQSKAKYINGYSTASENSRTDHPPTLHLQINPVHHWIMHIA